MITNANVVAYFAENVRKEESGQHTFVGVFDDIAEFSSFPVIIPQLSICLTISTLVSNPFVPASFRVFLANGETLASYDMPADIASQQAEAIAQRDEEDGAWIYLRILVNLAGVRVAEETRLLVEFVDSNNNRTRSNSLDIRSRRQTTTLAPEREARSAKG